MLKKAPAATFWTPVKIPVAGQKDPVEINVEYRYLDREELHQFYSTLTGRKDADSLPEIINDWKEVELEYSPENLAEMLIAYPHMSMALFDKFGKEVMPSKEKNS